jgi:hypothetical protein
VAEHSTTALDGARLLALWESAGGHHPIDAAVDAIVAAWPDRDLDAIRRMPLGERDAALLAIRRATIGDQLDARAACPTCGTEVEVALSCTQLMTGQGSGPARWTIAVEGYRISLRPLDSLDAAAAAAAPDPESARDVLLARAVVRAMRGRRAVATTDLPPSVVDALSRSLGERDSGADLVLEFACPACAVEWSDSLDVASFVTAELAEGGRRLLGEIDLLARAYGWGELEILALGATRRATYVAMVAG